ncbi:MAG: 50S ribosomal protein L10 [Candidatus Collierbacteria bacterium GW2011_GWB1_44_6]|uniref:Large ribosomal subunit protein uL10 n=1 Tax=Candidatus Collierbacteria bacterium GW2011_GWB1_44_6 TaxID=1618384 RepID=A0A0G1JLX1_9BACT|nr:MAG: 50S ribosomal protein L10 [Candidatus Collierbacteria bacterium GW2011_GWB1_44_6]
MPNQRKIHQLAEIVKNLTDSKAVILTEYAGLTVSEQNMLRAEADKMGGVFLVTKNNLMRLALEEKSKDLAKDLHDSLQGPTAVLFSPDAVAAAKIVAKFAEDHDKLKIKTGIMDDKIITIADIQALSKLPSREQLLASLLAQLQAPAQALVRQLQAPMQNFVYGLEALRAKLS